MQVAKWGNSLAVRLPAAVVEAVRRRGGIHLHPADWINFRHANAPRMTVVLRRSRSVLIRDSMKVH